MIEAEWQATWKGEGQSLVVGKGKLTLSPVIVSPWHTRYDFSLSNPGLDSDSVGVSIYIACDASWALSSARHLVQVDSRATLPSPVGRFLVAKKKRSFYRFEFPWASRLVVSCGDGRTVVWADLRNRQYCGLRHWHRGKPEDLPAELRLSVLQNKVESLEDCLWIEPYPEGAPAAFCLTDHPDFDSVEKVEALTNLFSALGLRLTKGVFPSSDPIRGKNEPGLDVADYARTITRLHEQGTEIAFHGIGPRRQAPTIDESRRRADLMRRFEPKTWIDHGTGSYLFSRRGVFRDGTRLTDFLEDYGIENYWSYVDIWHNPFKDLSFEGRCDSDAAGEFVRSMRATFGASSGLKGHLYPLSHLVKNLLAETGAVALRRGLWKPSSWRTAAASRRDHKMLRANPMIIYGLDASGFATSGRRTWIFDTILLNHPALQLRPKAIDRLRNRSGLTIAHSYLSCTDAHIPGGCFEGNTGKARLSPQFVENLQYLAQAQRAGEVSVLPFRDLRTALIDFAGSWLIRVADGWEFCEGAAGHRVVVAGPRAAIERLRCEKSAKRFRGHIGYVSKVVESGSILGVAAV